MTNAVWAVVPVKRFAAAKTRLAPALDRAARARLTGLMLEDVLDALARCQDCLAGVLVVTRDEAAAAAARMRGADVAAEAPGEGMNVAVALAARRIGPGSGMIVVPSDIPQVSPDAIFKLVDAVSGRPAMAIVPATYDGGTNLLACRPADAIPFCFGPRSFARHCRAARDAGIEPQVLALPGLGLDIDRPDDLAAFLMLNTRTRAHAFLAAPPIIDQVRQVCRVEVRSFAQAGSGA